MITKQKNKDLFCFVISGFNYGGIEILVSRLVKILSKKYQVYVFLLTEKYNERLLNEVILYSHVVKPSDYLKFPVLFDVAGINSVAPMKQYYKKILNTSQYLHLTDSHTIVFASAHVKNLTTKISVGNYHSQEYIWDSKSYFRKIEKLIVGSLNPKSLFNMNNTSRNKMCSSYSNKFKRSHIIPAGIIIPDDLNFADLTERQNELVSIGRLVKFKSFIEKFIPEIPKILEHYPDFQFDIYGEGPELKNLKKISKNLPVNFKGLLNNKLMDQTLRKYKVFIGSGTSILTASANGVPSIIGIESIDEPVTYGYLYETNEFDYQEVGLDYKKYPIYEKVLSALSATNNDYKLMCNESYKRSKDFSVENTVERILKDSTENHGLISLSNTKMFFYFFSVFIWAALNKLKLLDNKKNRHNL